MNKRHEQVRINVSLQVENPLQKFLATALSSQQQQEESTGTGRQSSRTSSSNQSESSSISPKRSAAKDRDASSDPPPVKRSPGRPPGSPNKVIFAKIVVKQKKCCRQSALWESSLVYEQFLNLVLHCLAYQQLPPLNLKLPTCQNYSISPSTSLAHSTEVLHVYGVWHKANLRQKPQVSHN